MTLKPGLTPEVVFKAQLDTRTCQKYMTKYVDLDFKDEWSFMRDALWELEAIDDFVLTDKDIRKERKKFNMAINLMSNAIFATKSL